MSACLYPAVIRQRCPDVCPDVLAHFAAAPEYQYQWCFQNNTCFVRRGRLYWFSGGITRFLGNILQYIPKIFPTWNPSWDAYRERSLYGSTCFLSGGYNNAEPWDLLCYTTGAISVNPVPFFLPSFPHYCQACSFLSTAPGLKSTLSLDWDVYARKAWLW